MIDLKCINMVDLSAFFKLNCSFILNLLFISILIYTKSTITMSDKKVLIGFSILSLFTMGIGFYKALKSKP